MAQQRNLSIKKDAYHSFNILLEYEKRMPLILSSLAISIIRVYVLASQRATVSRLVRICIREYVLCASEKTVASKI